MRVLSKVRDPRKVDSPILSSVGTGNHLFDKA